MQSLSSSAVRLSSSFVCFLKKAGIFPQGFRKHVYSAAGFSETGWPWGTVQLEWRSSRGCCPRSIPLKCLDSEVSKPVWISKPVQVQHRYSGTQVQWLITNGPWSVSRAWLAELSDVREINRFGWQVSFQITLPSLPFLLCPVLLRDCIIWQGPFFSSVI